jgi:hypothetical protein
LFTSLRREVALGAAITKLKVRRISDTRNRQSMTNQRKAAGLQGCNRLPILAGCCPILTEGWTHQSDQGGCGKPRQHLPALPALTFYMTGHRSGGRDGFGL